MRKVFNNFPHFIFAFFNKKRVFVLKKLSFLFIKSIYSIEKVINNKYIYIFYIIATL